MTTTTQQDALIDAAEERAKLYDDDDRECIKVDVMNAFFAGAAYAQAAANKAAEEGGLPALPCAQEIRAVEEEHGSDMACYLADDMNAYARTAIAADRASRQVANKAEVEPVAVCTVPPDGWHCTRQPGHQGPCAAVPVDDTESFTEAEEAIYQRGIEDGKAIESGMARLRAGIATPPATTGASTAPVVASIDTPEFTSLLLRWEGCDNPQAPGREREFNALIDHIDQHVAREVVAQAGQVAVPEDSLRETIRAMTMLLNDREWTDLPTSDPDAVALWEAIEVLIAENNEALSDKNPEKLLGWKLVPVNATFSMSWEIMLAHRLLGDPQRLAEDAWKRAVAVAPSPAKESK